MRAMFRVLLLILAGAVPLAAQITVSPQRIAGLSSANWSIGDGGPAVDALLGPSALAWDRAGNLLIADSRNRRIRLMTPGGVISTLLNQDGVFSMAMDSKGNLYVSMFPNSYAAPAHIFEFSHAGFSSFSSKAEIPNPASTGAPSAIAI